MRKQHISPFVKALTEATRVNEIIATEEALRKEHIIELLPTKELMAGYVTETRMSAIGKAIMLFETADNGIFLPRVAGKNLFHNHHFRNILHSDLGGELTIFTAGSGQHDQDYTLSIPFDIEAEEGTIADLPGLTSPFLPKTGLCSTFVSLEAKMGDPTVDDAVKIWRANDILAGVMNITGLDDERP